MVRLAEIHDLPDISGIYNQAILAGFQTAFTVPFADGALLPWFQAHTAEYPIWVYQQDGEVVGWLSISPYRQGRPAVQRSVEVSFFVHNRHHGEGIGSAMLTHAVDQCRILGYKTILAIVIDTNAASQKLLLRHRFAQWGVLPQVADFGEVVCGHLYFGRHL